MTSTKTTSSKTAKSSPVRTAAKAAKANPVGAPKGPRTDPKNITSTNVVGFPIGGATPDELVSRVGTPVKGHKGYYVRYPYASYDLAAKVGDGKGDSWMAVCRHGQVKTANALMGAEGVEKVAAARKTWCSECGAAALAKGQANGLKAAAAKGAAKAKAKGGKATTLSEALSDAKAAEDAKKATKATKATIPAGLSYPVREPITTMPEVGDKVWVRAHGYTHKQGEVVKVGRTVADVRVPMVTSPTPKVIKRRLGEMAATEDGLDFPVNGSQS